VGPGHQLGFQGGHALQVGRQLPEALEEFGLEGRIHGALGFAQLQGQQGEDRQLGGEGLGGGHADLGPCVGEQGGLRGAGGGGARHVADGQGAGAPGGGFAHGGQGVRGFAALGDADDEGLRWDHRFPVAVLGGIVDFHRHPGQLLDKELAHEARVPAGAAGHDVDALQVEQLGFAEGQIQRNGPCAQGQAVQQGVRKGLGLLEDLLLHEMLEAALFGPHGIEGNRVDGALHGGAVGAGDAGASGGELCQIPILQVDHPPGVAEQGHHIRSQERLAIPQADDEGRAAAGRENPGGIRGVEAGQGVDALHAAHGFPEGGLEGTALGHEVADHHGEDFGIGFRCESATGFLQLPAQFEEVLEDAVVHGDHLAAATQVGVGVLLRGAAVGGPAGVSDAERCGVREIHPGLEGRELARGPYEAEGPIAWCQGDACAVVAAVLQGPQPLHEDGSCRLGADVTNNAAHGPPPENPELSPAGDGGQCGEEGTGCGGAFP